MKRRTKRAWFSGQCSTQTADSVPLNGNSAVRCADGVWRTEQDSVAEAVRYLFADEAAVPENLAYCKQRMAAASGGEWANHYTEERFRAALVNPPSAILEAVELMRAELVEAVRVPQSSRRRVRRGQEFGEEMNADAFLNREPNCWDRNTRIKVEKRTVTIGVNIGVNGHQSPDELLWRGAAAAALADVLTSEGINVGIVALKCCTGLTTAVEKSCDRLVVKSPTMPLDLGAVSFALSEVAFFRFCGVFGDAKKYPGRINEGFGQSGMAFEADKAGMDFLIDFDVRSREAAVEWLRKAVPSTESEVSHA